MQFDYDKDEQGAKQQVVDNGEVTSPDVLSVVLQKGAPGLTAGRRWLELVQILLDGAFADLLTQHPECVPHPTAGFPGPSV